MPLRAKRIRLSREGFTRSARPPTLPPAGSPVGPATSRKLSGVETMAVNDQNNGLTNEETSVLSNPNFQALVRERSGFGWTLTIIMLVIYFGFILLVAFGKGFMATKIGGRHLDRHDHRPGRHRLGRRPDRHLHPAGQQPLRRPHQEAEAGSGAMIGRITP